MYKLRLKLVQWVFRILVIQTYFHYNCFTSFWEGAQISSFQQAWNAGFMCRAWMKLTLKIETSQWISKQKPADHSLLVLRAKEWLIITKSWEAPKWFQIFSNFIQTRHYYTSFKLAKTKSQASLQLEIKNKAIQIYWWLVQVILKNHWVNWTKLGKISLRTGFQVLQIEDLALYKRLSETIIK